MNNAASWLRETFCRSGSTMRTARARRAASAVAMAAVFILLGLAAGCAPKTAENPAEAAAPAVAEAAPAEATLTAAPTPEPTPFKLELANGGATALATFDGGAVTAEEVAREMQRRRMGDGKVEQVKQLQQAELDEIVRFLGLMRIAAAKAAQDQEFRNPTELEAMLNEVRNGAMLRELYKTEILDNEPEPAEEQITKYYEDHLDQFRVSLSFGMRHIFLSTYKVYTVKEGDTLESIAKAQVGDASATSRILFKDTKRPRDGSSTEEGQPRQDVPGLSPGEELLVPMSAAEIARVRDRIKAIHQQLKDGADFVKLAQENSEAGSAAEVVHATPSKSKPMLEPILNAVKTTPVGGFSEPIQTKHGFQIIQVVERQDEKTPSLQEVRGRIVSRVASEQRSKRVSDLIDKAFRESKRLQTNMDDVHSTDGKTLLASIGETQLTVETAVTMWSEDDLKAIKTRDDLLQLLKRLRGFQQGVLVEFAEGKDLAQSESVKAEVEYARAQRVGTVYLDTLADKGLAEPTDEEIRATYEEVKDRQYKKPRRIDLHVLTAVSGAPERALRAEIDKAREEVVAKLETAKAAITDLASFLKAAEEIGAEKEKGKISVGMVPETFNRAYGGALANIQVHQVVGPVEFDGKYYLLWAESEEAAGVEPLETVRGRVAQQVTQRKKAAARKEIEQSLLDAVAYKTTF